MSSSVIEVRDLGKRYTLGQRESYDSLREAIRGAARVPRQSLARITGRNRKPLAQETQREQFWAIRDVSFDVAEGEVLGIIGSNGAGKSTLLKILTRITEPTAGRAVVHGKVGSLLEVGTGFHPELTGRENIFLSGAILGMRQAEIGRKLEEIVEFSEIERFLDTPVKRYSSGMYVRLAFAVAASLEPEVLLLDEVLAVGDTAFQRKCLNKMRDIAEAGRTVLFVSHNMQAVSTLTDRSLLLDGGRVAAIGPTSDVLDIYLRNSESTDSEYKETSSPIEPRITRVWLDTSEPNSLQRSGQSMTVNLTIETPEPMGHAAVSIQIADSLGRPLVHAWSYESPLSLGYQPGIYRLSCTLPHLRLYMGHYSLIVHFSDAINRIKYQTLHEICPFEVILYGRSREYYDWADGECVYFEDATWTVKEASGQHRVVSQE